jgi:hypothetical protein
MKVANRFIAYRPTKNVPTAKAITNTTNVKQPYNKQLRLLPDSPDFADLASLMWLPFRSGS